MAKLRKATQNLWISMLAFLFISFVTYASWSKYFDLEDEVSRLRAIKDSGVISKKDFDLYCVLDRLADDQALVAPFLTIIAVVVGVFFLFFLLKFLYFKIKNK
ncbi:MAG: hypothetical protein PHE89_07890 [Alphaproteobacteria bacterium]|nr:hypothetical protein [Alphaproteobacteria bacterium]